MSFLVENGLHLPLLFSQLFVNDVSTFFAVDLVITALVFLVFSYRESQRQQMGSWWICVVSSLAVGPSLALPLFRYLREQRLAARARE